MGVADRDWNRIAEPERRRRPLGKLSLIVVAVGVIAVAAEMLGGDAADPGGGALPQPIDPADLAGGTDDDLADGQALDVTSYDVGDCVTWDAASGTARTEVVACDEPHRTEITGELDLDGLDAYPTAAGWDVVAGEDCLELNEAYLGAPLDPYGVIWPHIIHPLEDSWRSGDRTVWCGLEKAGEPDGAGSVAPFTGSVLDVPQQPMHQPGACLDVDSPREVPCDEPHQLEITGSTVLGEGLTLPAPRDDAWFDVAAVCEQIGLDYAGGAVPAGFSWTYIPVEQASYDAGARTVHCALARWEGDRAVGTTGSVRSGGPR